jgi:conjugal transfer mating pair stabilization protein TraG
MPAPVLTSSASLSSAKNSYDQYTNSRTRSHEYSEMASRTESMSGQMSENLTQQFANFVQQRLHRMQKLF